MLENSTELIGLLKFETNSTDPLICSTNSGDESEQLYVKLSTFWYCFLALITSIGLIVSLISNMIIVYLFSTTPSLRENPSNIIAVNLSLSDLLYCTQWPSVIYCSLTQSTWILEYHYVCQSFGFITVSTALASILTVLFISVERAIVIVNSIHAKNHLTIKLAWLIIVLIWLVSIASCVPPLLGKFNRYTLDPSKTSCTLDYLSSQRNHKLYILVLYVVYWIIPAIIILISYALIIVTFKRSSLSLKEVERSDSVQCESRKNSIKRETKLSEQTKYKLRDSIRLNNFIGSISHKRSCSRRSQEKGVKNSFSFKRKLSGKVRRASASSLSPQSVACINEGIERSPSQVSIAEIPINDARLKTFKRGASSSLLLTIAAQKRKENIGYRSSVISNCSRSKQLQLDTDGSPRLLSQLYSGIIRVSSVRSCQSHTTTSPKSNTLYDLRSNLSSILNRNSARSKLRYSLTATMSANSRRTRAIMQFRLAKMSFYLILLWLVSWTPIASLAMLNSVIECYTTSATAVFMASTMTKLGPAFDVFIYGISHPKIKSRFKQIIKRLFRFLTLNTAGSSSAVPSDCSARQVDKLSLKLHPSHLAKLYNHSFAHQNTTLSTQPHPTPSSLLDVNESQTKAIRLDG